MFSREAFFVSIRAEDVFVSEYKGFWTTFESRIFIKWSVLVSFISISYLHLYSASLVFGPLAELSCLLVPDLEDLLDLPYELALITLYTISL